jgi:hypothetical protein
MSLKKLFVITKRGLLHGVASLALSAGVLTGWFYLALFAPVKRHGSPAAISKALDGPHAHQASMWKGLHYCGERDGESWFASVFGLVGESVTFYVMPSGSVSTEMVQPFSRLRSNWIATDSDAPGQPLRSRIRTPERKPEENAEPAPSAQISR